MKIRNMVIKSTDIITDGNAKATMAWMQDKVIANQREDVAQKIITQLKETFENVEVSFPENNLEKIKIIIDGIHLPVFCLEPKQFLNRNGMVNEHLVSSICVNASRNIMATIPFKDYEQIKPFLRLRMIEFSLNEQYIRESGIAFTRFGDFMAICEVHYDKNGQQLTTPVTNHMLELWGITQQTFIGQMFETARKDTPCLYPLTEEVQNQMIVAMLNHTTITQQENLLDKQERVLSDTYTFTFEGNRNGILLLGMPDLLKMIGDYLGKDYYITPVTNEVVAISPVNENDQVQLTALLMSSIATPTAEAVPATVIEYYSRDTGTLENAFERNWHHNDNDCMNQ